MAYYRVDSLNDFTFTDINYKKLVMYENYKKYIKELQSKTLPESLIEKLNLLIDVNNQMHDDEEMYRKSLNKIVRDTVKLVEKEAKIVPLNFYTNNWLIIGTTFGVTLGSILSNLNDEIAFLGLFIAIGLSLGYGYGKSLDNKAIKEGRQINVDLKVFL